MGVRLDSDRLSSPGRHRYNHRLHSAGWGLARPLDRLVRHLGCFQPTGRIHRPFLFTRNQFGGRVENVYELRTKASSRKLRRVSATVDTDWNMTLDAPGATVVVVAAAAAAVLVVGHDQMQSGISEDRSEFFPSLYQTQCEPCSTMNQSQRNPGKIKEKSEYLLALPSTTTIYIHRAKHSMPKKFVDTSPRRWGTRFDSLVPASPNIPQTELSSPSAATPQLAHQSVRPVPSGHRDLQKLPHDASVFVGSLPSTVDHRELIRALYDHLSPHTEILSIKVVRDSRHGGVCAFVQCEVCVSPYTGLLCFLTPLIVRGERCSAYHYPPR